jgi:hypothetical protein
MVAPGEKEMNDEKRVELLLDHYKDTFQTTFEHWKTRNRFFAFILIVLGLMLFQITSPKVLEQLANSYIRKQTEPSSSSDSKPPSQAPQSDEAQTRTDKPDRPASTKQAEQDPLDFRFLASLLWFVLAALLVPYYQKSVAVDRQFRYLGELEIKLNALLGGEFITREGKFYGKYRPWLLRCVGYFYHIVFPLLLHLILVVKLVQEVRSACQEPTVESIAFTTADLVVALVICVYTVLYLAYLWNIKVRARKRPESQTETGALPEKVLDGADNSA